MKRVWGMFVQALPFIVVIFFLAVSAFLFWFGYSEDGGDAASLRKQTLLYTIGSSILSAGVFAALLKSIQFLKIFERVLENIVLTNKEWLKGLTEHRLKRLWEDTTAAIVVKGFPELSANLTKDVLSQMVPKLEQFYYSKIERRIELRSYDKETDKLEVYETYYLDINAHSDEEISYTFNHIGPASTEKEKSIEINFLEIDGADQLCKVREVGPADMQLYEEGVCYEVKLTGKERYSVKRHIKRLTTVSKDPVLHMSTQRFVTSMKVTVDNRCAKDIQIRALPIGIAKEGFKISKESDSITVVDVDQLMFPGDGLIIVYERR